MLFSPKKQAAHQTTQLAARSNRKGHEPLTYQELSWHRSRVRCLVSYTRSLFGDNIPIMFRTRHLRESNKGNRVLRCVHNPCFLLRCASTFRIRVFQLDQNLRHVSKELGVKLFVRLALSQIGGGLTMMQTWGDLLEGYTKCVSFKMNFDFYPKS